MWNDGKVLIQRPEIDDTTEQFGRAFCIVQGRVRLFLFPLQPRRLDRPGQYRLAVCQAPQSSRIKSAEGVKTDCASGRTGW